MLKKYFKTLFILFNVMMLVLPVVISVMALKSILAPDKTHIELLGNSTQGTPILVGYSGGSTDCVNTECDNSKNVETYNYLIWPESFLSETYYSVVRLYTGDIEVEAYSQNAYLWLGAIIVMLFYGAFTNIRLVNRIVRR